MRGILTIAAVAALLGGCLSPAAVEETLPKLRDKLDRAVRVYLPYEDIEWIAVGARDMRLPYRALKAALQARGVAVATAEKGAAQKDPLEAARAKKCGAAIVLTLAGWEYSDAGFSGFGHRDAISLGAALMDVEKDRVTSRATITVDPKPWTNFGSADPAAQLRAAMEKYAELIFGG